jgi:hypothetical protein
MPTMVGSPAVRDSRRPPSLRRRTVSLRRPRAGGRQRSSESPPSGGWSTFGWAPRFARVSLRHGARACAPPAFDQTFAFRRVCLARGYRRLRLAGFAPWGTAADSRRAITSSMRWANSAANQSVRRLAGVCRGSRILGVGLGSYSEAGPKLMRGRSVREIHPCGAAQSWKNPVAGLTQRHGGSGEPMSHYHVASDTLQSRPTAREDVWSSVTASRLPGPCASCEGHH